VVVSHAAELVSQLSAERDAGIVLQKQLGETLVDDGDDAPPWTWLSR